MIEVSYWTQPQILTTAEDLSSARGEAVVVDFGDKGQLFVLLKGDDKNTNANADRIVRAAFGLEKFSRANERYRNLRALSGSVDLPASKLPVLVRFRDINDPKSVERVDPANLAASFGDGVKLIKATIEITNDPVTMGIEKRLGWLDMPWERRSKQDWGPLWTGYGSLNNSHFRWGTK